MPTTMPRRRIRRRVALNCARPIRVYGSSPNARTCSEDCRRAVRIVTMVTIARHAAAVATGWGARRAGAFDHLQRRHPQHWLPQALTQPAPQPQ